MHERTRKTVSSRRFNYELDYRRLNLREQPELYRVGIGEQGVLLVEPYKSEILPHWRFKNPEEAERSSTAILKLFRSYVRAGDFIGMDMARKFLQMGYTRSRRYANHASGRKYDESGKMLPFENDEIKAASARIFWDAWKKAEADPVYSALKAEWKLKLG
ncbi:MAG: DUF4385 domain-containing protein [Bdellovibrionia bacterium]